MKTIKLSKRLETVLSFIPRGSGVADIGTDHGHLPVYLAQTGISDKIIASDIGREPLESARRTALDFGVLDKIRFVQAPGLSGIKPGGAETIIIAGMGGETIIKILSDAPWTALPGIRLILQPQSKTSELSHWLTRSGYALRDASLTLDGGRLYVIILACRADCPVQEQNADCEPLLSLLSQRRDPLLGLYLDSLIKKTRGAQTGLLQARTAKDELAFIKDKLKLLITYKEETKTWLK